MEKYMSYLDYQDSKSFEINFREANFPISIEEGSLCSTKIALGLSIILLVFSFALPKKYTLFVFKYS